MRSRCPGMDPRHWRPEDVTEASCPRCGARVEFLKDDLSRRCPECGTRFGDPDKDLGCIQWCRHAHECLGIPRGELRREEERRRGEREEKP
jgi:endogenous inhibitor of DNA gyrase (YacG/DUF329 family)